ncbi:MAG TPA: CAP domain-containing protein [Chryseolinea sp.]|nr:CAP domain-containing protein [Chryseolinea sp.]
MDRIYKLVKNYHLLVFHLLLSLSGFAQRLTDEVNLETPDLKKLEWLTFGSVNKLRQEKNLIDLAWDDVLYRAAKDHADFLIHEKKISHLQKTKGKETPAARVKLHGGILYTATGENVIQIQLGVQYPVKGRKLSTVTYKSTADVMAALWKTSPGHYRNIISNKFNCTALATSYDPVSQRFIAVQVFGFTHTPAVPTELPDYSDQLLRSSVPHLPYGLKKYKGHNPKNQKAINGFMNLKQDRGYLTGSFRSAKKIFKGRRSGIAQEFIPLSQFDSASLEFTRVPNRRNGLYELNGTLSKPAYRREMLKFSRKYTTRKYLIDLPILKIKRRTRQFLFPLHGNADGTAFNLFIIKQKQLQAYRTYSMVPSRFFEMEFPRLKFKNNFKPKGKKDQYKVTYQYDTIQLQVFYPSKVVTIDKLKQLEIENSFNRIRGKIVAVKGEAFASIDGDENDNDRLARERMHNFMLVLNPYLDTTDVAPDIITREQWEFFQEQVDMNNLTAFKNLSTSARRTYVNENKKDTLLLKLLDAQRYTRIRLVWRKDLLEIIPGKSALQEYEALKISVESTAKPNARLIQQLEQAQLAAYYQLAHEDTVTKLLTIPDLQRYPAFKYHDLMFRYSIQHSVTDKDFYNQLHELAKSKYFPSALKGQAVYNNHVLIYRNYSRGTLDSLLENPQWGCRAYTQSEIHLKRIKKIKCKPRDYTGPDGLSIPDDYFVLKEIPPAIRNGQREKIMNFPMKDLWRYYYLYTIQSLYSNIPLPTELFSMLPKFKEHFHPNDAVLTDEERVRLALFYSAIQRYETALNLVKPLAVRNDPNKEALKMYLTLIYFDFNDPHEFSERLIQEFTRLGKEEWCSLWGDPEYLNFLQLEDLRLKKFYNCNCGGAAH